MRTEIRRISMYEALALPPDTLICIEPVNTPGGFYAPEMYERCATLEMAKTYKVKELGGFNSQCRVIIFTDEPPKPLESMPPMERLAFQLNHLPERRGLDFKAMEKHLATNWISAPGDWAEVSSKQAAVLLLDMPAVRDLITSEQYRLFITIAEAARLAIVLAATPPPQSQKLSDAIRVAVDNSTAS